MQYGTFQTWSSLMCLLVTLGHHTSLLAQEQAADYVRAELAYRAERSDPITHDVDLSIVVTPPYHCQVLKVWIPIPQTDVAQEIGESQFSTFPMEVKPQIHTEPVFGNNFAYFEFHKPKGAQIVRHRFQAKVWTLHWKLQPESVVEVKEWPKSFTPYLRTQTLEDEKQFQTILQSVVPDREGGSKDLTKVMDWIGQNLTYDHVNASLQADANHALIQRRGHCSDYHGLCATMGRALGYPTRVTYGLALYPKNSPSHCKVEAFLPPTGWVSFDLSETQKLMKKIQETTDLSAEEKARLTAAAQQRLLSGFRENSWLMMTKGTDYELAPKAAQKVRVVRTAYVEADGEALPDPDPANSKKREFAWMTVHKYQSDRPVQLPFKDLSTLKSSE